MDNKIKGYTKMERDQLVQCVKDILEQRGKWEMKISVSEWKALRKETKLKLLRYAVLESKNRRVV